MTTAHQWAPKPQSSQEKKMTLAVTSDQRFAQEVLASDLPVVVEFTAEWCGPCRMIAPVLEKMAADERDRLRVITIDVDKDPDTAARYKVLGMPTLALFKGGEVVARILGARSGKAIMKEFEPYLATS
jgi:thioredoxin 1